MEISSSIKCNDTLVFSCQMWGVSYMHLKKSSNVYYWNNFTGYVGKKIKQYADYQKVIIVTIAFV